MTEIFLLRHAQSSIRDDIPNKDWMLSEDGALQAVNMTSVLIPLMTDFIYSSPYLRCRETVTPYAKSCSKIINIHQGLKEVHVSYDNTDDFLSHYKKSWLDFDYCLPSGESCNIGQKRALAALDSIATSHRSKRILVSTHGNFIGLVLKSIIPNFSFEDSQKIKTPDLIHLKYEAGTLKLADQKELAFEIPLAAHAGSLAASFSMFSSGQ